MDLTPYVATLRESLATAAAAGDEQTRKTAAVLSSTLEPAARLAIMNALADLAAEVTVSLSTQVVDIRLDGREVRVVVTDTSPADEPEIDETDPPFGIPPNAGPRPGESSSGDPAGDVSRVTVRLLEELKTSAEQAAAEHGQSLNAFITQAVQRRLHEQRRREHGPRRSADNWREQWWTGHDWNGHDWSGQERRHDAPRDRGRGRAGSRISGWVEG